MNEGKTIFSQIMNFVPKNIFDKYVKEFKGNYRCRTFSSWDQFLCLSFAQLTYRESLRDIEVCLKTNSEKLYHMGIKGNVAKTNLSRANKTRDWRIFAQLARHLINEALALYTKDDLIYKELDNTLYALDSTTIDLCLSLFHGLNLEKINQQLKYILYLRLELQSQPLFTLRQVEFMM